jgi:hypothetical protein
MRGALTLEVENVFKIAVSEASVREYLARQGWDPRTSSSETEMDSFRDKASGKVLYIEDITEDFPVTFLMGQLSLREFSEMANHLAPEISLLEVESSWEGNPTTIVVAMSEDQVRSMFGRRTKMRPLPVRRVARV